MVKSTIIDHSPLQETGSTGRQGRFLFGPASTIHSHLGYVGGDPFAPPPLYYRPISMVMAAIHGIGAAIMDIIGVISRLPPPVMIFFISLSFVHSLKCFLLLLQNVGDGYDPGPGPMYDDDGYDFGGDYDSDYRNLPMPSRPRPPRPRPSFSPMGPVQFQVPPPMY